MKTKSKNYSGTTDQTDQGKISPHALDIEEAILGALLLDKQCIPVVLSILLDDSFYKEAHQLIFNVIKDLHNQFKPVDILTVTTELRNADKLKQVGGAYYVTQLTNRVASTANVEAHCRIVEEYAIKRRLIPIFHKALFDAYDNNIDALELLSEINLMLSSPGLVFNGNNPDPSKRMTDTLKAIFERDLRPTLKSEILELDNVLGGWNRGDFYLIAGRPGSAKTALALHIAQIAAKYGAVGLFQLEMSLEQMGMREISSRTAFPLSF